MKVVKKLLAPVLVVGLLLTSLVTLHNLKDTKKDNVFRIGISQYITHKSLDATRKGFIEELKKEGYVDGKNIQIDFQNAQGEQRNLKNISKQLAEESDLVFAIATPSAQSLANTTKSTPIVFSAVTDPLAAKLVKNLKEPGGNITGTSDQSEDAISTQVDMIKQVLPTAKTVGILYTQSEPNSVVQKDNAKKILEAKGYQVVEKTILDSNNVKAAADSIMSEADIVFVPTDNIISSTMETVKQVSISHKVPVFGGSAEMVATGGLYNFGTDYEELGRQAARMAIRIMKGEKPGKVAVETPEKLELHTNKEMAKELGIDIVNLGLIYRVDLNEEGHCQVDMTLTTMGCPLADIITDEIHRALAEIEEVKTIDVKLVWYPAWSPDRMSRYARIALGIR